jgi:hypothetical protein
MKIAKYLIILMLGSTNILLMGSQLTEEQFEADLDDCFSGQSEKKAKKFKQKYENKKLTNGDIYHRITVFDLTQQVDLNPGERQGTKKEKEIKLFYSHPSWRWSFGPFVFARDYEEQVFSLESKRKAQVGALSPEQVTYKNETKNNYLYTRPTKAGWFTLAAFTVGAGYGLWRLFGGKK